MGELRRDCTGAWMPEALASILAALYALGGQVVDGDEILNAWGLDGGGEDRTVDALERWIDRQGRKHG